jgi:hypothetical protein
MTASSRATTERKRPGGGRLRTRSIKLPAHADAVLAEQGPDDRDVARARVDQGVAHPERPRTWRWGSESRWAGATRPHGSLRAKTDRARRGGLYRETESWRMLRSWTQLTPHLAIRVVGTVHVDVELIVRIRTVV